MSLSGASKFTAVCPIPSTVLRLGPPSPRSTRFHVLRSNFHHQQVDLPSIPPPPSLPCLISICSTHLTWYRYGTRPVHEWEPSIPSTQTNQQSSCFTRCISIPRGYGVRWTILGSAVRTISSHLILALRASRCPLHPECTTRGFRLQISHCASRCADVFNLPGFPRFDFVACCHRSREREQYLHLPPVHLVGIETVSVNCAQRFAILYASHLTPLSLFRSIDPVLLRFPELVLSLTLINVPPPTEYESCAYMHQGYPLIIIFCCLMLAGRKIICICWTN